MFTENISLLRRYISFENMFGDSSIVWDSKLQRVRFREPPSSGFTRRKVKSYVGLQLHMVFSVVVAIQIIYFLSREPISQVGPLVSSYIAGSLSIMHIPLREIVHRQEGGIVSYVNGLLEFDVMYGLEKVRSYRQYFRGMPRMAQVSALFGMGACFTCHALPIFEVYGLHIWNPCKPTIIGYWLLEECSGDVEGPSPYKKWGLLVLTHMLWQYSFKITPIMLGVLLSTSVAALRENIALFRRYYEGNLLSHRKLAQMYREIQLMADLGNGISQRGIMGSFSVVVISGLVVFTVTLVLLTHQTGTSGESKLSGNWILLLSCCVGVIDCILAIVFTLGPMAAVYLESCATIHRMKSNSRLIKQGFLRREKLHFIRSCPAIKLRFGSLHYVDEMTALKFIDFASELTIFLLLII